MQETPNDSEFIVSWYRRFYYISVFENRITLDSLMSKKIRSRIIDQKVQSQKMCFDFYRFPRVVWPRLCARTSPRNLTRFCCPRHSVWPDFVQILPEEWMWIFTKTGHSGAKSNANSLASRIYNLKTVLTELTQPLLCLDIQKVRFTGFEYNEYTNEVIGKPGINESFTMKSYWTSYFDRK